MRLTAHQPTGMKCEVDLYELFISDVYAANLCNGYKFALSPNKGDEGDDTGEKWKRHRNTDDPFDDLLDAFEASSDKREKNRGQLISYASKLFAYQHRTFLFSVVLLRGHARIIWWDRAAAIVTDKFNYRKEPEKLGEFLHLFCRLPPEGQGYDLTASLVRMGSEDYDKMLQVAEDENSQSGRASGYAKECFKRSLDPDHPWYRLSVTDETPNDDAKATTLQLPDMDTQKLCLRRDFLVGKPLSQAFGMSGSGTRNYIALDASDHTFVALKDEWRLDNALLRKEGDTLRILHVNGVKRIPTVVCHGDACAARDRAPSELLHG
ncbi:hypothetical protein A0H81_11025 [Grifola frondosa]|uniref:Fungal-type protein kinase domain-containing protein n=1 Tax=Grifola frondosa TaxID=5627 RepID=A0A1C7LWI0_GRIFR|nr:hypothetical protein A0H81_11025 [Grifola frondosa]